MATGTIDTSKLLTAEEYAGRLDPGYPEELVRGRSVRMAPLTRRHGQICLQVGYLIRRFLELNDMGHVVSNDSGVITSRDPDTVRGPDIAFYSYRTLPKGPLPAGYGPEVPELAVEVRSPGDRWADLWEKVGEYLKAGVGTVLILDDERRLAHVFTAAGERQLQSDEECALPEVLPGFVVPVARFFE
jgi:Uma2 family endonuclease